MPHIIVTIHALGEAQKEIAASVKELKNSILKPSEKASDKDCTPKKKASQEESAAAAGKGPKKALFFVTHEDVIAMLEKKLHRSSKDWKYVQPPYLTSVLYMSYPNEYETSNLVLFSMRYGSPKEHRSHFINALGPHASDCNLRLKVCDTPWSQAEGWAEKSEDIMDFSPSYDDEVFTVEMSEEYSSGTPERQQNNQEMMTVTSHNLSDMEIDLVERYLS
ncbi:hypothetical protein D8674_022463 [Pyrus ussuriensis x Pyrus communis]|uniref:Uncharacterized protein n=1 Tax=Pyrus ussuriensis x Pyrus communis TaxID=2448454 RepID=A0A5N5GK05_9ROSA|nr:hypothetical protein D8674_022463 [Pyrus ussuriensis x Pyrus communis]